MQTICDCLDLGERLLQASLDRYGTAALQGAMRYVCDADAERMTRALARLPDGTWRGEALVDCDGLDDREEYPVRCTLRKRGARIEIDLSGTARQARTSINGTFLDVKATVGVALKFLLDPNGRFTSGMYRPVDIVIPPGAICSALPPQGVVFAYGESTNALLLAMLQAMADAVGEDAVAGDTGSPNLHTARGVNADGTPWIAVGVAGGEAGPVGRDLRGRCGQLQQVLPGQQHRHRGRGQRSGFAGGRAPPRIRGRLGRRGLQPRRRRRAEGLHVPGAGGAQPDRAALQAAHRQGRPRRRRRRHGRRVAVASRRR